MGTSPTTASSNSTHRWSVWKHRLKRHRLRTREADSWQDIALPDRLRILLDLPVAAAMVAGCAAPDAHTVAFPTVSQGPAAPDVVDGLCADRTNVDDSKATADAFARAHGPLHDLAWELADIDRGQATRFLGAKQQVESASDGDADSRQLAARLDRLLDATRQGLDALDRLAPDYPTR